MLHLGPLIWVNKWIFNFYSDIGSLAVGSFSFWLNLFLRNYFFESTSWQGRAELQATRKQWTHGRFIRQSQIGIWSTVIASNLVLKLLCDGSEICETFLKFHQAQTFRLAFGRFLFSTFLCARIGKKASAADTKEQKLRRLSFYLRLFPLTH